MGKMVTHNLRRQEDRCILTKKTAEEGQIKKTHTLQILGLTLQDFSVWNPVSNAKLDFYWKPWVKEDASMYQSHNRNTT